MDGASVGTTLSRQYFPVVKNLGCTRFRTRAHTQDTPNGEVMAENKRFPSMRPLPYLNLVYFGQHFPYMHPAECRPHSSTLHKQFGRNNGKCPQDRRVTSALALHRISQA